MIRLASIEYKRFLHIVLLSSVPEFGTAMSSDLLVNSGHVDQQAYFSLTRGSCWLRIVPRVAGATSAKTKTRI